VVGAGIGEVGVATGAEALGLVAVVVGAMTACDELTSPAGAATVADALLSVAANA